MNMFVTIIKMYTHLIVFTNIFKINEKNELKSEKPSQLS